jgi:hypothetical protein
MQVTAWNNGTFKHSGAGYGFRFSLADRDHVFSPEWREVIIDLPDGTVVIARLSPSFWERCPEVRSAHIGKWLREIGKAAWPAARPPIFQLRHLADNRFSIELPSEDVS